MHELGVLFHALETVDAVAKKNNIRSIKHITLEIGRESDYVPAFFEKLFPLAAEKFPIAKNAELRLEFASGEGLFIRDIGY